MRDVIVMLVLTSIVSQSAFAAPKACGYDSFKDRKGRKAITCPDCRYMDQFAEVGASFAKKAGLSNVIVYGHNFRGRSRNAVAVNISVAKKSSSFSIAGSVGGNSGGASLSYSNSFDDLTRTHVEAMNARGRAKGSPWAATALPNSSLDLKCDLEEEKNEKEKMKRDKAEAITGDMGLSAGMTASEIQNLFYSMRFNQHPPKWDDCRNCTTESVQQE